MKKIAFSMTVPSALRAFMADHVRALSKQYDVTVFCNFSDDDCADLFDGSVKLVHVPFERKICPLRDLKCLFLIVSHLRKGGFSCVHSVMPKTGLLAMSAGWLARVPVRIHMYTGQVWVTRAGVWRTVLKSMDKLIAYFATDIYADSPSQRDFLISEKVAKVGSVLGDGSVNGVDCEKFKPDAAARKAVREQFNIPAGAVALGFMGRLNRDKGINDLVEAFTSSHVTQQVHLLLVGPDEEDIEEMIRERFPEVAQQVHFAGYTSDPARSSCLDPNSLFPPALPGAFMDLRSRLGVAHH